MTRKNRIILIQGTDVTIHDQGDYISPTDMLKARNGLRAELSPQRKLFENDHSRISQEAASKGIG